MKKMKRTLAIVLALVMVLGVMPLSSFAADTTTIKHMETKPADSTTENEPFPQGTGGSNSFRIPALVTLSDGTLVAAADARWNTTYDGGGLDTIVSISTDNGANWSYSFANYMGDNGNTYSGNSTCFIDPSLAVTANDTIYMLVDLYPSGVALNGSKETDPVTTKGFNDAGYLLLTDDGYNATGRSYDHYLKDGKIYTSTGEEVNNYTVDAYFNVFKGGTYHSNLFFDDCDYTVVRTGFLYLTKGTYDKTTKTIEWSAPTLLNLKTNTEMVCLVGPGRGLVTSKGTIIFPVYSYNGESAKYTGLIYSEDNGATWSRTDNLGTAYTSEATLVELGNGNLRVFVRNENSQLTYYDYTLNGNSLYGGSWGGEVKTGVKCNSDTELSAIVYSKTVDGNPVVLVSAPAGPNAAGSDNNNGAYRSSGKIFMGLINDDYTMTWKSSSVAVTNVATSAFSGSSTYTAEQGFFAYSCLTEQDNGSVSILYEDSQQGWGSGTGYGYTMAFKTYTEDNLETAFGVTFDAATTPDEDEDGSEEDGTITVRIPVDGTSKTFTDDTGNYQSTASIVDGTIAEMKVTGTTVTGGTTTKLVPVTTITSGSKYYISDGNGNFLSLSGSSIINVTDINNATEWTVTYVDTPSWAGGASRYTVKSGSYYIRLDNSTLSATTYTDNINHYYTTDAGFYGSSNGSNAWVYSNGDWTVDDSGNAGLYTYETVTTDPVNKTEVSFTGLKAGTTTAIVGTTQYNITVYEDVDVKINYVAGGKTVATGTVKVPSDAAVTDTVTLPGTVTGTDGNTYTVNDNTLTLSNGTSATYNVPVTLLNTAGGGFVASADITAGSHNSITQVADLVGDDGTKKQITEMTVTVGIQYDLDLATDTTGKTVEWSTKDGTVATVDANGNVTAVGEGSTYIIATVRDADGNIVEVNAIPITVFPASGTRKTAIYIDEVTNTTVWCVFNGDTENYAFEVVEGELIYGQFAKQQDDGTYTTAVSFFGNPKDNHALVYMKSTNSDDQYYMLHQNGTLYDGTVTANGSYYVSGQTSGAGYWQAVGLANNQTGADTAGWDIIKAMVQWAIDQGCDGGMGFTRRQDEGDIGSNLSFDSDPLPTIDKTVDGVLPTSRKQADYRKYTQGMVAGVGELVYFKITITLDRPSAWADEANGIGAITYTDAIMSDKVLDGAYLYTKELDQADGKYDGEIAESKRDQISNITDQLNAAWDTDEQTRTIEFYLVYQIQTEDIPRFTINNVADLNYTYKSKYSMGATSASANALASITVVGKAMDNVVIDFGQKVVYTGLSDTELKGVFTADDTKFKADYGTVEVTKNADGTYTVTYTPTSILHKPDAVWLYGLGQDTEGKDVEKIINGFVVYPATSVYYEEGFLFKDTTNNWNLDKAEEATLEQEFEKLGASQYGSDNNFTGFISDKEHPYGYDPNAGAGNSYASATAVGANTTFTFTGTGFQLYANCTESTGYISVKVKNSAGALVKVFMVNTVVGVGEDSTAATAGQSGNMNSLPIVSYLGLEHGTYTVTLTKVMDSTKNVYIDGIRIFNTVADSSIFAIDLEDNPEFYELRDYVLNALSLGTDAKLTADELAAVVSQIYTAISSDTEKPASAVITSNNTALISSSEIAQDLLENGPKNEIYLSAGQTLTFNVTTSRTMQIGLKAPKGATTASIAVDNGTPKSQAVSTSVDMFYDLVSTPAGSETEYTISITNSGSAVLSITLLKVCDDPSFAFTALTEEDIEELLVNVYDLAEVKADANLTVDLKDYTGKVLGSVELSANGVEGQTAVFTAAEILAAAKAQLPAKYAFVDESAVADVEVVYGQSEHTSVQIGKVATLKIKYVSMFGRTKGTATITVVQTARGYCRITASEIKAAAPAVRRVLWTMPVYLPYGNTVSIVVPVM